MTADARLPRLTMRARLTLWYASALALSACAMAIGGYSLVERFTLDAADESLSEVVTAVGDGLELESHQAGLDGRTIPLVLREFRFPDITVAVLDPAGDTLYSSTDVGAGESGATDSVRIIATRANPDGDDLSYHLIDSTTVEIRHASLGASDRLRLATVERRIANRGFRIGVLRTLTSRERVLNRLRVALIGTIPILILLAGAGGNIVARAGLRPISHMAERAWEINAANLQQRLPPGRPDDEPGRLALAFNGLLERLDAAFDRQRQFVADASHELRTPLSIVSGESQLPLSRGDRSSDELRASLLTIQREADRLQRIVADLFLLARADANEPLVSMAPLYLGEIAAECVRSMATLAESRGVALAYRGPTDLFALADEQLLSRLIMNLIDNATKYTPRGGHVTVTATPGGDFHEIRVIDSGGGIPAALQSRIFERFYQARGRRVEEPEARPAGAGLGLAIARSIATAHGGTLTLERSDESGSTFLLRIPRLAS